MEPLTGRIGIWLGLLAAGGLATTALWSVPPGSTTIDPDLLTGLGDTRYHLFESETLDRGFHLFVRLPEEYDEDGKHDFPTIYLLDGGVTYPLLAGYYRYLTLAKEIPIAILVGISYGTNDFREGNMRGTDFTAASPEREHYGGAPNFQQVLREELIPMIESTYRSDGTRRVIFGQSIGGQFVLYTALTDPDLFWGHIASNPAIHRNLPFFLQSFAEGDRSSHGGGLFISTASDDEERLRTPALQWIEHWSEQQETPWRLESITLEGHGHFSAVAPAFRQGLRWLFED